MKNRMLLLSILLVLAFVTIPLSVKASPSAPSLNFTIEQAGNPGTLTLTYFEGSTEKTESWTAKSGNNDPSDQCEKNVGPIPSGVWPVNYVGSVESHPTWWPVNMAGTLRCNRNGIYIHGWGTTTGCIAVSSFTDFSQTLKDHWPEGAVSITLTVSYPNASVGGTWVPVDKLGLLTPYIGLTSAIIIATASTAIYVEHVKRRKKKR